MLMLKQPNLKIKILIVKKKKVEHGDDTHFYDIFSMYKIIITNQINSIQLIYIVNYKNQSYKATQHNMI
jgi:hypothetical protein